MTWVQLEERANHGIVAVAQATLAQGVQEVRVLNRDEFKQEVMRKELHDPRVKFYLGDVRDRVSVDHAMGMSKALTERTTFAVARNGGRTRQTIIAVTRYGNRMLSCRTG